MYDPQTLDVNTGEAILALLWPKQSPPDDAPASDEFTLADLLYLSPQIASAVGLPLYSRCEDCEGEALWESGLAESIVCAYLQSRKDMKVLSKFVDEILSFEK